MPIQEMDAMNSLASEPGPGPGMDPSQAGPPSPDMSTPPGGTPVAGPSGAEGAANKIDTPQEEQAMKYVIQGSILLREAANTDPSIRYIIDDILLKGFTAVTKHYGLEQEGKLGLQQAQLQKQREQTVKMNQPSQPPGPPVAPVAA